MGAFNTPEWESNAVADKTSKGLLKGIQSKVKHKNKTKKPNTLEKRKETNRQTKSKKLKTKIRKHNNIKEEAIVKQKSGKSNWKNNKFSKNEKIEKKFGKSSSKTLQKKSQNVFVQESNNDAKSEIQNRHITKNRKHNNIKEEAIVKQKSGKSNWKNNKFSKNVKIEKKVGKSSSKTLQKKRQNTFIEESDNDAKSEIPKRHITHQIMFCQTSKKKQKKLKKLKEENAENSMLTCTSPTKNKNLTLRERMLEKLKGARFRYLNEQMYTSVGKDAKKFFDTDPSAYEAYHQGYRQQVNKWPINPLDVIIERIKKMARTHIIADFGCGEAKLAKSVNQTVHSFDLVAVNDTVTACDMAHVPLEDESVNVVVFCLSLMGTNLKDYLVEARRVLKTGGLLKIVEIESRFQNVDDFVKKVQSLGFNKVAKDLSFELFCFLDFAKKQNANQKRKLPDISLTPCLYKKR